MAGLISTFGIGSVIIILLIAIPAIVTFIKWCKNIWRERENFKQEQIQTGKELEAAEEAREARMVRGEQRMDTLEDNIIKLTQMLENQLRQLKMLTDSDSLSIKANIKEQHEKWIPHNCIDSQTLELLEQRYAIYKEEGGNSWAEKLMKELRALPTVTVVPTLKDEE